MQQYHVAIAAEAFATGLFAQAGCNVLIQYGANQPQYDFVAVGGERTILGLSKRDSGVRLGIDAKLQEGSRYHEAMIH